MYNDTDIIIYKCSIIQTLLEGKEPKSNEYVGSDGLTEKEYSDLIKSMEKEGLINPVNVAQGGKDNCYRIIWFNGATTKGERYLDKYLPIICGD